MLLLKVADQLGNQMFAYASVKTIASDLGYDFKLLGCSDKTTILVNDHDNDYGHTIDTIFEEVAKDVLDPSDGGYSDYAGFNECIDRFSTSAVDERAYGVKDNTLMTGHYISPLYFKNNMDKVREWFRFPEAVSGECRKRTDAIRDKYKGRKLVAVHFRVGDDYYRGGYLLDRTYWERAAFKCRELLGEEPVYILFYDKYTKTVSRFENNHTCEKMHDTLVYDMCAMGMADANIVCNSSFSIMGAMLNKEAGFVIAPSGYAVPWGIRPEGAFPEDWIRVEAGHDKRAYAYFKVKTVVRKMLGMST